MSVENGHLVDQMIAAIENNDLETMRAIHADDVTIWHNYDDATQSKEENLALLSGVSLIGRAKYHILERVCVEDRVIQRQEVTVTTFDGGRKYHLSASIFVTVRDGKIAAVHEYADSRQLMELVAAIQQAIAARGGSPVNA